MNILSSVKISGFRGDKDFTISFHPDVNFLIGMNGSGKTTVINMVAAALNADFQALDRLPFARISLQLAEVGGSKKPSIEVEKTNLKDSPFSSIKYKIKEKASGEAAVYSLDDLEEQLAIRELSFRYRDIMFRRSGKNIVDQLRNLTNVSWLSIHRFESLRLAREERSYESTVDKKIDELSSEFIKYFSQLSKKSNSEISKFQKTVFLSLIPNLNEQEVFSAVKRLNLKEEREALIAIFREFNIEETAFTENLEKHFSILKEAVKSLEGKRGINSDQLVAAISALRINSVVQEWKKLIDFQESVNEPKETFLQIINSMLKRKHLEINDKNELIIVTDFEKKISLKELSSGEKQLLIILGAALLQEKQPWIYIADEPELSLHVEWQAQLITNLRKVNPEAQILFATHSPDIVSMYGNRVFDMGSVTK